MKKILFLLIFFTLASCGYQPIYSKKDTLNISIKKIELVGDKTINRKIISLANLKEGINENYSYNLTIDSRKNIETVAKDKSGNASVFKTTIIVKFYLKDPNNQDNIIKTKNFTSSFSYNNITNKFDLSRYQKTIEINLIEGIVDEITIFINS